MEFKLFVGNLAKSTTRDDLRALFEVAGEITSIEPSRNRLTG